MGVGIGIHTMGEDMEDITAADITDHLHRHLDGLSQSLSLVAKSQLLLH